MYITLGTGCKRIIYYNADKSCNVNIILEKIAAAYRQMLAVGYPSVTRIYRDYTLIFTDQTPNDHNLLVHLSLRPCGIYTDWSAYHRKIAQAFLVATGLNIISTDHISDADIEIGIGGFDAPIQGYVMLKDAVFDLLE